MCIDSIWTTGCLFSINTNCVNPAAQVAAHRRAASRACGSGGRHAGRRGAPGRPAWESFWRSAL